MNEIQSYLNGQNPDFDQGFALFCKYSRNQSLMKYIGRKRDMAKLLYQLEKFSIYLPKPNPFQKTNISMFAQDSFSIVTEKVQHVEIQNFKTYDDRKTKRSELPEEYQKLYDENIDDYKILRSFHEKMKLSNSDAGRADFRVKIIALDKKIKVRWKTIDEYLKNKNQEKSLTINVNTQRAYISKMLKKEILTEEQIIKLKQRVKELIDAGGILSEDTLKRLRKRSLI
jgi:hypothetical protein